MPQEELNQLQRKAFEQFKSGQSLFGKDGAFAPMLVSTRLCTMCWASMKQYWAWMCLKVKGTTSGYRYSQPCTTLGRRTS